MQFQRSHTNVEFLVKFVQQFCCAVRLIFFEKISQSFLCLKKCHEINTLATSTKIGCVILEENVRYTSYLPNISVYFLQSSEILKFNLKVRVVIKSGPLLIPLLNRKNEWCSFGKAARNLSDFKQIKFCLNQTSS